MFRKVSRTLAPTPSPAAATRATIAPKASALVPQRFAATGTALQASVGNQAVLRARRVGGPMIHRASTGAAFQPVPAPAVANALDVAQRASGRPIDPGTRSLLEGPFGRDLSQVRVRDDAPAHQASRNIGARAYTARGVIAFGPGQYRPGSAEGLRLLAHEVAHVLQRGDGGTGVTEPVVSRPNDAAELAADRAANQVVRGERARVAPASTVPALARSSEDPGWMATADEWWGSVKESTYDRMIAEIRSSNQRDIGKLRALARELPAALQDLAGHVIDGVEILVDCLTSFGLALIGIVVGLVSGVAHALWGLLSMLEGVLEGLILVIAGLFDPRARSLLEAKSNALIFALTHLPDNLRLLWDSWLTRFKSASPERQSLMIGELTGEIEAILLQALGGGAAASAAPGTEFAASTGRMTATMARTAAVDLAGPGAGMVFAVNVTNQIDERAKEVKETRPKQAAAPEAKKPDPPLPNPPPKTPAEVDKIWEGVGKDIGTENPSAPRGGVKGAVKAGEGFPRGNKPAQVNSEVQFHKHASDVREAKGVTGKQFQSAHGGASSWLNKRVWRNGKLIDINYSRADAVTKLLPPDVHASFDKYWKAFATTTRQGGVNRVPVSEMLRVMRQAVGNSAIAGAEQGSLMMVIESEVGELGLEMTDLIELPYTNVGP